MAIAAQALRRPSALGPAYALARRLLASRPVRRLATVLPGPLGRWTTVRELPVPAPGSFRAWWRAERRP